MWDFVEFNFDKSRSGFYTIHQDVDGLWIMVNGITYVVHEDDDGYIIY